MIERDIEAYFDRLWPILRSITGDGVRRTHDILGELVPLQRIEIPSGSEVLDWTVPKEWRVKQAYVVRPDGKRILDIATNNLHIVNYSAPFRGRVSRAELDAHLFSLPDLPTAIPYVTSYYKERWGFCIAQAERDLLPDGEYEVVVDTELFDGSLTLSECVLRGESEKEILISTYTCHPSLANNELSGPLVAAFLYKRLAAERSRRFTYRFVFLPETIGSITYLSLKGDWLRKNLVAGYVVTCSGDPGPFTYKYSRRGDTLADRAATYALKQRNVPPENLVPFFPSRGSDERQYCSPGYNLPVGSVMRTMYGKYKEYHTSLDNREFVSFSAMAESVDLYFEICRLIERNAIYKNTRPYGEPQLGKHGLYPDVGGAKVQQFAVAALLWVLNLSDGEHDLLDIAERCGIPFDEIAAAAERCRAKGLLA